MYYVAIVSAVLGITCAQQLKGLPNDRPASRINATTTVGTISPPRTNVSNAFPPPPQNCSAGENWTSCWSSTCWEAKCGVAPSKICSRDCKAGCRCADGFARLGRRCIVESACPNNDPVSSQPLLVSSSMSNRFNQTERECGAGEVWTMCSSSSCFEHRCDSKPSLLCTRDCRMGCKCADGFARLDDKCVNETQCITWRSGKLGKLGKGKGKNTQPSASPTVAPTVTPETMFVGPFLQKCEGGADNSSCLVTKSLEASEFSSKLESIEGFDFVSGFDYKLLVRPKRVRAGKIKYILVSVTSQIAIKKTKAPSKPAAASSGCAEVMCMVFCDYGYKKNNQGCEICSCLPAPAVKTCPDVTCDNLCPSGYQRNSVGCATCNCAPLTTMLIPPPAYNCNSAADWSLAKVAACCVPLPPAGSIASNLCKTGFQSGFSSFPTN